MKKLTLYGAAIVVLVLIVFLLWRFTPMTDKDQHDELVVRCDQEASLAETMSLNQEIRRFRVIGKCDEENTAVIAKDDMIIKGEGPNETVIVGRKSQPVIEVVGAKNFVLAGVTLTGGEDGILARSDGKAKGVSVTLQGVIATGNGRDGARLTGERIVVDQPKEYDPKSNIRNDRKQPTTSKATDTTGKSISLFREAIAQPVNHVLLAIESTENACKPSYSGNGGNGIFADDGVVNIKPSAAGDCSISEVDLHDNGESGLKAVDNSVINIQEVKVSMRNTQSGHAQKHGMHIIGSRVKINANSTVEGMAHTQDGLLVEDRSTIDIEGDSLVNSSGNTGDGIHVEDGSKINILENSHVNISANTVAGIRIGNSLPDTSQVVCTPQGDRLHLNNNNNTVEAPSFPGFDRIKDCE